jgi:RNA polymerase sigma-70 factor (ECF subfamily)
MSLSESEHTTPTTDDIVGSAELEAGLVKLMPSLRAFAQSLSGNRDLAEDLTQEALAKAWRSRRTFARGSNLKAWVFAILRNEFYSHRRRAWRQIPWDAEKAETIPGAPEEQVWATELSDAVSAINGLPDVYREALMLVGAGEFSYDDAAALTGCAAGTMKSRVARARKLLKASLGNRRPLPIRSVSTDGSAMSELLSQLSLAQSRVRQC